MKIRNFIGAVAVAIALAFVFSPAPASAGPRTLTVACFVNGPPIIGGVVTTTFILPDAIVEFLIFAEECITRGGHIQAFAQGGGR